MRPVPHVLDSLTRALTSPPGAKGFAGRCGDVDPSHLSGLMQGPVEGRIQQRWLATAPVEGPA